MKNRIIGAAVAALAALALIGAPTVAYADEPTPGSDKQHAIVIEPRTYQQSCSLDGTGKFKLVAGTGASQQYSWVGPRQADGHWEQWNQTGLIGGVWYSYGEGTWQEPWTPNLSQIVLHFPSCPVWSDEPGAGNATWVYADTDAYTYSQRRFSNGKVQLVATPNPGYVFAPGAVTQWQKLEAN